MSSALTGRYAYNEESVLFTIISIASLVLAGVFFMRILRIRVTILANTLWMGLGALCVTLASYLIFGERISPLQGLGMACIIAGAVLIQSYSPDS